tara:strand:+ start:31 stop:135 length:105 start_codon:yes stop_codon:yes gene_type:complete
MRDQKFTHAEVYRAARLSVAPMMDGGDKEILFYI